MLKGICRIKIISETEKFRRIRKEIKVLVRKSWTKYKAQLEAKNIKAQPKEFWLA